jgi:hypothetical protein
MDTEGLTTLKPRTANELRNDAALIKMIHDAIEADCESEESEWAQLSPVGSYMNKTTNDFDPRNYGFSKLRGLISAIGLFAVGRRDNRVYVKDQRRKG